MKKYINDVSWGFVFLMIGIVVGQKSILSQNIQEIEDGLKIELSSTSYLKGCVDFRGKWSDCIINSKRHGELVEEILNKEPNVKKPQKIRQYPTINKKRIIEI